MKPQVESKEPWWKQTLKKIGDWFGSAIVAILLAIVLAAGATFIGFLRKVVNVQTWVLLVLIVFVLVGFWEWFLGTRSRNGVNRRLICITAERDALKTKKEGLATELSETGRRLTSTEDALKNEQAHSNIRQAWISGTDQLLTALSVIDLVAEVEPQIEKAIGLLFDRCLLAMHQRYGVRAVILIPQGAELWPWITFGIEKPSFSAMRPQLRPQDDDAPIGTAALAYMENRTIKGYVVNDPDGTWYVDAPQYIQHSGRRDRPPYECFICIPLTLNRQAQAVLCLDSATPNLFDDEKITAFASSLRRKLNSTLGIWSLLRQQKSQGQPRSGGVAR